MKNSWGIIVSLVFLALVNLGCKIYSFTGTTLDENLETITIDNFAMATAGGPENMTFQFNEKLKEYYQRNTTLKIVPSNGDLYLTGAITSYEMTPVATTGGDKAAQNRLSIQVEVQFQNNLNPDEDFDKTFSFYQDFSQEQTLTAVEPRLVPDILDQLVLNIFNDTAAQW